MLDLAARCQHDHRQHRFRVAQRCEHLEPAAPGQHHVEDDEVDVLVQRLLGSRGAVERRGDLESVCLQPALEEVDDPRLVLDHEDHAGHVSVAARDGRRASDMGRS